MTRLATGIVCFIVGLIVVPAAIYAYLAWGHPPVAVADGALPFEKTITGDLLNARIQHNVQNAPIQGTAENLAAGASIYKQNCAFCHGLPQQPSQFGANMFPNAPQLWKPHGHGVVGVSDDPVGETFWKVKNGIRLTGMPAYTKLLSEDQMWQVSLLLSAADKPMPPAVQTNLAQ